MVPASAGYFKNEPVLSDFHNYKAISFLFLHVMNQARVSL